jgi:hypothetical protein
MKVSAFVLGGFGVSWLCVVGGVGGGLQ